MHYSFRVRADDNDAFVTCSVRNLAMENRVPLEVKSPRLNVSLTFDNYFNSTKMIKVGMTAKDRTECESKEK